MAFLIIAHLSKVWRTGCQRSRKWMAVPKSSFTWSKSQRF